MAERHLVFLLSGAFLAVLIWRSIPSVKGGGAPTAADPADTMGSPVVVPTLPAELIIGQSQTPDDGDSGPVWYTVNYPGARPGMPAIPRAAA